MNNDELVCGGLLSALQETATVNVNYEIERALSVISMAISIGDLRNQFRDIGRT